MKILDLSFDERLAIVMALREQADRHGDAAKRVRDDDPPIVRDFGRYLREQATLCEALATRIRASMDSA